MGSESRKCRRSPASSNFLLLQISWQTSRRIRRNVRLPPSLLYVEPQNERQGNFFLFYLFFAGLACAECRFSSKSIVSYSQGNYVQKRRNTLADIHLLFSKHKYDRVQNRNRHPTFFICPPFSRTISPSKNTVAAMGKVNSTSLSRRCLVTMVGAQEKLAKNKVKYLR